MGVKLTTQDIETTLYKILNASTALKSQINGGIYKDGYRPGNSRKEDVCISTLALTQEQPQVALCNINVYVPDSQQLVGNAVDYIPNSSKLKGLANTIKQVIDQALLDPSYADFSLRVDSQRTFKNQDTEAREHFQNIRLELIIPNK